MGGAQRSVLDLVRQLRNTYTISVAAGGSGSLFEHLKEIGVKTHPLNSLERDINLFKEVVGFFRLLKLIKRERPDVIHLHSPKVGGLGAVVARILGVKRIVYTAHGWAFFENRPLYQKVLIRLFSYLTILFAHYVIAVSKKDAQAFSGWPFVQKKIVYIPNGIAPSEKVSTRNEALEKMDIVNEGSRMVIGTIAELHRNKGLSYLVEAAARVKEALFIIIGSGEEKAALEESIKKHRLEDTVILAGYRDNASQFLSAFDIFILPSLKEGLPYAILEAGRNGTAVVASNIGGIPDVIQNGESGILIPPKNSEAIVSAIETLREETIRNKMGAYLQQRVKTLFSLDQMVEKTVAVYNQTPTTS